MRTPNGTLTYRGWIDGLAAGRSVVSRNAHREFLDLKVNRNTAPGDEISLAGRGRVGVNVRWSAAEPLTGKIEVVRNGAVVVGRAQEGLREHPGNPAILYNLACAESRAGRPLEALTHLQDAIRARPDYRERARTDPDFDPIRREPGFP